MSRTYLSIVSTLLMAGALCGCHGAYEKLVTIRQTPEYCLLEAKAAALPERMTRVVVGNLAGEPQRVAIHETGDGWHETVVVLLHGVISDSRAWRFMRPCLAEKYDLMAVDLPGCGDSDAPDPREVGDGPYAPSAMAHATLAAVRQRLAARSAPANVVFAAHSLGGMVVLRMFSDRQLRVEFGDVLSKTRALVLFAPVDIAIEKDQPMFRDIIDTPRWMYELAGMTGGLRRKLAASTLEGTADPRRALREESDRIEAIFSDGPRRVALQAMLRQAIPQHGARPDWARIKELVAGYARVNVPCLIVWGYEDEVLPASMGHKLRDQLPDARLVVLEETMHCAPIERPSLAAILVDDFIQTRGQGWKCVTYHSADEASACRIREALPMPALPTPFKWSVVSGSLRKVIEVNRNVFRGVLLEGVGFCLQLSRI